jgi:hypothetical protein
MRASAAWLLCLLTLAVSGCAPEVDLSANLEVLDVGSGWHDAGIVDGKNKLVPSITFKLKNNSDQTLSSLQVNALFRRVSEGEEWGSAFLPIVGSEGLAPGATTNPVTANSSLGYTGTEPRADMLKNEYFVDAKVELFAKYASAQWKKIGEYPITRQLLAQ